LGWRCAKHLNLGWRCAIGAGWRYAPAFSSQAAARLRNQWRTSIKIGCSYYTSFYFASFFCRSSKHLGGGRSQSESTMSETGSLRHLQSATRFVSMSGRHFLSPIKTTSLQMASPTATAVTGKVPKIAVIGGGAAGLAAARVLSRAGWNPVVLEKGDTIGGVWNYKPKNQDSQQQNGNSNGNSNVSPMYRGLRTNLPKEIMAFREFPWPDDLDLDLGSSPKAEEFNTATAAGPITDKSFVTHAQVQQYLQAYAAKFNLKQYIRTGCQVEQLTMLPVSEDQSQLPGATSRSEKSGLAFN
jgi:hypothetical protein